MTKEGCIINPATGRAVKTTTPLGKKLMAQAQQLDDEYKGQKVLKTAAKRALAQKEVAAKNDAGNKLAAAAKRAITKKPEAPKPAKKFGFEDLPGDVKDIITGVVKKNKNRKDMIKDLKYKLKGYKLSGYTKMTNEELYDWVYGGKLDEAVYKLARPDYLKEMKSSFDNLHKEKNINWSVDYMTEESGILDNIDTSKKDGKDLLDFFRFSNKIMLTALAYIDVNKKNYLLYKTTGDYNDDTFLFEIIPKKGSRLSGVFDTDGWTNNKIQVLKYSMKEFLTREKFKINGFEINCLTFLEWFKNKK